MRSIVSLVGLKSVAVSFHVDLILDIEGKKNNKRTQQHTVASNIQYNPR